MKKTKAYRPRRGIHFSKGRLGVEPVGGFVGSGPIKRSRPGDSPEAELSVQVRGDVMSSIEELDSSYNTNVSVISSSSIAIESSISMGRLYERQKLTAQLISGPTNYGGGVLPGKPVWPSTKTMELGIQPGFPTGTFIMGIPGRIQPPSWTLSYMGTNRAFVNSAFTSSNYDSVVLNTYASGSDVLELTSSPTTKTNQYSKESRFQTIMVKKTASFFDTLVPTVDGIPVSGVHVPAVFNSNGLLINTVTGTNGPNKAQINAPAIISIPVNQSGKLVDIKVWLEIVHVSASGRFFPLGTLGVALRSPNVTWGVGIPVMNDPARTLLTLTGSSSTNAFIETNKVPRDYYRDTFILWQGGYAESGVPISGSNISAGPQSGTVNNGGYGGNTNVFTNDKPTWDRDRGMRTIFSDGSSILNPRNLYGNTLADLYVGAPNTSVNDSFNNPFTNAYGLDVPWTTDASVAGAYSAAGSPPVGWLTGPGGTAAVNEWNTTGSNLGTETLNPFLPLLDPIVGKKNFGDEGFVGKSGIEIQSKQGSRPGLRGTEISGTWQLLLINNFATNRVSATASMDTYFRQVRLEITYDTQPWLRQKDLSRYNPHRSGDVKLCKMSGSASSNAQINDYWCTDIFITYPEKNAIGRTFGISTSPSDNAAVTFILTGALSSIIGTSNPPWLFSSEFGNPQIPMTSASLVPFAREPIVRTSFEQYMQPRRDLDTAKNIVSIAGDQNPAKTLAQLASSFVSASTT